MRAEHNRLRPRAGFDHPALRNLRAFVEAAGQRTAERIDEGITRAVEYVRWHIALTGVDNKFSQLFSQHDEFPFASV